MKKNINDYKQSLKYKLTVIAKIKIILILNLSVAQAVFREFTLSVPLYNAHDGLQVCHTSSHYVYFKNFHILISCVTFCFDSNLSSFSFLTFKIEVHLYS